MIPPECNSEFVANMEKVLDVYKRPYDEDNPVVCMDESPKQLISEARPSSPMKPGQETRVDYEYVRHVLNGQCLNRHISTIEKVIEED